MEQILLIDDDENVREMLSYKLEKEGYRLVQAKNGQEGLALFQQLDPQVTLLDLDMPISGGLDFLKKLTPQTLLNHAFIVLTGYGGDEDMEQCYHLGVHFFLRKPFNLFELLGIVKRAFEINRYILERELQTQLLRNTFDNMTEGVIRLNAEFMIQMMSSKACQIIGVEEGHFLGKPAIHCLGAAIAGGSGLLMECQTNLKGINEEPTQLFCPSGAMVPVKISITPLSNNLNPKISMGWLLLIKDLRHEERIGLEQDKTINFGSMISCNSKMKQIFYLIDRVAKSQASVLLQGESGTGKELIAREIHDRSNRAQGPFLAVNCGAIASNLMESEFFGHERGAFTGATQMKLGRFELAKGGTLFLDEVSEIPLELQSKLLRVLQERKVEKVGGSKTIEVDIRIFAATNQDLETLVQQKKFREDLYYRLKVVVITIPPLRDRREDIPLLINCFRESFNRREKRQVTEVENLAMRKLMESDWPGNIRELYHVIEHAFAVSTNNTLKLRDLPEEFSRSVSSQTSRVQALNERERILQVLEKVNYNKGKAAAILGIHRGSLSRKLKTLGLAK